MAKRINWSINRDGDGRVVELVKTYPDGEVQRFAREELPRASDEYLWGYGAIQKLTDCHSTAKQDFAEARRMTAETWEALTRGILRRKGGAPTVTDEELIEALIGLGKFADEAGAHAYLADKDEKFMRRLKATPEVREWLGRDVPGRSLDDLLG